MQSSHNNPCLVHVVGFRIPLLLLVIIIIIIIIITNVLIYVTLSRERCSNTSEYEIMVYISVAWT